MSFHFGHYVTSPNKETGHNQTRTTLESPDQASKYWTGLCRGRSSSEIEACQIVAVAKNGYWMWVVVKIMLPFWTLSIPQHLVFRGPKQGP